MGKASKSSGNSKAKEKAPDPSSTTGNSNSDIQSWCEVPSIAHFCSLFRQAFDLLEFDIQELEESLLLMGTEDDTSQLVLRLLIKLLKGCSRTFTNNINEDVSIFICVSIILKAPSQFKFEYFKVVNNLPIYYQ